MRHLIWLLLSAVSWVSGSFNIDKDSAVYKAYAAAAKDIIHLEKHNFETLTGTGRWTIFYGTEGCSHCQRYPAQYPVLRNSAHASDSRRFGSKCSRKRVPCSPKGSELEKSNAREMPVFLP